MKRFLLLLALMSVLNNIQTDIVIPKYRKDKNSLKITETKKYADYKWYAKVDYKNSESSEFQIMEDPYVLQYMHYNEKDIEVSICAINKKT